MRLLRADADLREMELAKERGLMVALPDIESMLTDLVLRIIQRNSKRPVEAPSAYETRASSAYALATAYAALGEKDEAFVWLENLYETHEIASIQLKAEPCF